nr:hypothetical protein [Accumulibacter sp.]
MEQRSLGDAARLAGGFPDRSAGRLAAVVVGRLAPPTEFLEGSASSGEASGNSEMLVGGTSGVQTPKRTAGALDPDEVVAPHVATRSRSRSFDNNNEIAAHFSGSGSAGIWCARA